MATSKVEDGYALCCRLDTCCCRTNTADTSGIPCNIAKATSLATSLRPTPQPTSTDSDAAKVSNDERGLLDFSAPGPQTQKLRAHVAAQAAYTYAACAKANPRGAWADYLKAMWLCQIADSATIQSFGPPKSSNDVKKADEASAQYYAWEQWIARFIVSDPHVPKCAKLVVDAQDMMNQRPIDDAPCRAAGISDQNPYQ